MTVKEYFSAKVLKFEITQCGDERYAAKEFCEYTKFVFVNRLEERVFVYIDDELFCFIDPLSSELYDFEVRELKFQPTKRFVKVEFTDEPKSVDVIDKLERLDGLVERLYEEDSDEEGNLIVGFEENTLNINLSQSFLNKIERIDGLVEQLSEKMDKILRNKDAD